MTDTIRKGYEIEMVDGEPRLYDYSDYGKFKSNKPTAEEDYMIIETAENLLGNLEKILGTNKIRVKVEIFLK